MPVSEVFNFVKKYSFATSGSFEFSSEFEQEISKAEKATGKTVLRNHICMEVLIDMNITLSLWGFFHNLKEKSKVGYKKKRLKKNS